MEAGCRNLTESLVEVAALERDLPIRRSRQGTRAGTRATAIQPAMCDQGRVYVRFHASNIDIGLTRDIRAGGTIRAGARAEQSPVAILGPSTASARSLRLAICCYWALGGRSWRCCATTDAPYRRNHLDTSTGSDIDLWELARHPAAISIVADATAPSSLGADGAVTDQGLWDGPRRHIDLPPWTRAGEEKYDACRLPPT